MASSDNVEVSRDDPNYQKLKKYDKLPYRLSFIRQLLGNRSLQPLIDSTQTAGSSTDIREVLEKKIHDFNNIISSIDAKLVYIKSGSTGHTFRGVILNEDGVIQGNFALKVVAFPRKERYGNMNDVKRPENAELVMLKTLSDLVITNQTPHIILPIATFNTSIRQFIGLKDTVISNKRYDEFVERYRKNEFYEHVSVLLSEWANGGDLLDYLRKNHQSLKLIQWKVIFFQLLSVLAVIHNKYPDFRHNDLKANNVLVHRIECHRNNNYKYKINGQKYVIPNIGVQVKLWDFDFACIPSLVPNSKVTAKWTDKINIKAKRNQYYDLHYFFNTLTKKGFVPEIMHSPDIPEEVKLFIERVVPDEYANGRHVTDRGRILHDIEFTTPDILLRTDPFFAPFRVK